MIYSRLEWWRTVFLAVNCFVLSVLTYSSSQLIFLSIRPEAMCNISTLLESRVERPFSNAGSPWLHLCHLRHACRQEPFLGCCFFPRWPWHSAYSHTTAFIPSYRPPLPNNMDRMGQPYSTGCANNNLLFRHFLQAAAPVFSLVIFPGDVLRSVFNISSGRLIL